MVSCLPTGQQANRTNGFNCCSLWDALTSTVQILYASFSMFPYKSLPIASYTIALKSLKNFKWNCNKIPWKELACLQWLLSQNLQLSATLPTAERQLWSQLPSFLAGGLQETSTCSHCPTPFIFQKSSQNNPLKISCHFSNYASVFPSDSEWKPKFWQWLWGPKQPVYHQLSDHFPKTLS